MFETLQRKAIDEGSQFTERIYRLVHDNDTRWNRLFAMTERALKQTAQEEETPFHPRRPAVDRRLAYTLLVSPDLEAIERGNYTTARSSWPVQSRLGGPAHFPAIIRTPRACEGSVYHR
jgi:hypothetical protein